MNEYADLVCRWVFGLQMFFWGLNGFFHWIQTPAASPAMNRFVEACFEAKFIMPTIKVIEIVFGFMLLLNILVPFSLMVFAPLMFILTGLQIFLNKKYASFLATFALPYALLLALHSESLLRVIH